MDRPRLYRYEALADYVRDMIQFRKHSEKGFTVKRACAGLRRCSPALISHIISGKRRLTLDRLEDLALILALTARERQQLRDRLHGQEKEADGADELSSSVAASEQSGKRRQVSSFLLKNWINPYVKDVIRLASVREDPKAIYRELAGIASRRRIDQSLRFLVQNGYLRIDGNGRYVESEALNVVGDRHADQKIRTFHKRTLDVAKLGLDLYPLDERLAQAMLLPLDTNAYGELVDLIRAFSESLKQFSEKNSAIEAETKPIRPGEKLKKQRLYQLLVHLSPTGGSRE